MQGAANPGIPARVPVLIVGAGPTGLMLANQLTRRGVRVLVIDRNAGPSVQTKALGVQARTLEIYDRLGIATEAVRLGAPATGANMWVRGRRAARVPVGDIGQDLSPYPYLLILGQDDNERLLGQRLREQGVHVHWGMELVTLSQDPDRVTATLKRADGSTAEVAADWVGGCDGARSAVRTLCGIDFVGAPYEHVFFVADTYMTGPMVPGELNVYLWNRGFHLFFPMRGKDHWRVVGILPPALRDRDDLVFDEVVPSIKGEAGAELTFQKCTWFSTYRIHHRRAARFRDRRCFLMGDAAHIHSPVGAQGMNTGLQDAYNLAWKLALVASGRAGTGLLDSYTVEREPVAERLLGTTDRAFAIVVSHRRLAQFFRTRLLPRMLAFAMTRRRARIFAFRTISQIGIRYPGSPLSEELSVPPAGAPRAGDRFPWVRLAFTPGGPIQDLFTRLDDTRFNLIVVGQPAPREGFDERGEPVHVHTHAVPDDPVNDKELRRAGIPKPSYYLLRPDGHVGLAGARLEAAAIARYMGERVGLRTANR